MTPVELAALLWAIHALGKGKKTPIVIQPQTPVARPPPPPAPPPAGLPAKPTQIQWPQAGVPGAHANVATRPPAPGQPGSPIPAGVPGAQATISTEPAPPPARPPPPPPIVDEKMPTAQKAGPAVSNAAQRGIDQMKQDQSGTGKRQYKPKRRGLKQAEIAKAKSLLGGWHEGGRWRDDTDPSVLYVAVKHGAKKGIEVWTSNPDFW